MSGKMDDMEIVRMVGITKRFPGVTANLKVNFDIKTGEIHALLGENGAGKTTLMNILYGLYQPDEGEIYIRGRKTRIKSPADAIRNGIGMVHQHFMLIPLLSVEENIALMVRRTGFRLRMSEIRRRVLEIGHRYGLEIDPEAKIWQLSVGEKQRVELIKMLLLDVEVLILDEPTSVLTPIETSRLFDMMREMKRRGKSIVFITHKLKEALGISDRITILRKGRKVATIPSAEADELKLARLMIGEELFTGSASKSEVRTKRPALVVKNVFVLGDQGNLAVKNVSLEVYRGEILGIAGVAGNGQKELAELLGGLRRPLKGELIIDGKRVTKYNPRALMELGVAFIPEDRVEMGICPNLSVKENLILRDYHRPPFSKRALLNSKYLREFAAKMIRQFGIMTPNMDTKAKCLSGGNIQRMVLAREFHRRPKIIVVCQPTRGLDIRATEHIRSMIIEQRNRGAAVILISEDIDEILKLSDRIAVMYRGEIAGILGRDNATPEMIGTLMAGLAGSR